jgi:hypothetical protein
MINLGNASNKSSDQELRLKEGSQDVSDSRAKEQSNSFRAADQRWMRPISFGMWGAKRAKESQCVTAHMETASSLVHSLCWLRSGGQAKTSTGKDYRIVTARYRSRVKLSRGVCDMCDHLAKSPMDKKMVQDASVSPRTTFLPALREMRMYSADGSK